MTHLIIGGAVGGLYGLLVAGLMLLVEKWDRERHG